jgi:hypothetical protein
MIVPFSLPTLLYVVFAAVVVIDAPTVAGATGLAKITVPTGISGH